MADRAPVTAQSLAQSFRRRHYRAVAIRTIVAMTAAFALILLTRLAVQTTTPTPEHIPLTDERVCHTATSQGCDIR